MTLTDKDTAKENSQTGDVTFYLMCIATLFGFVMTTTQSLLPIVLEARGVSGTMAGFPIASTAVSALLAGLMSASLMARYGTPTLMYFGMVIMFVCHIGLEFGAENYFVLFVLRLTHGLGTGIFMTSALTFVKGRLSGPRTVSLFGMYASMIPGAFLIGPPLGDLYLSLYGERGFFLISAIPGAVSVLLLTYIWLNNRSLREDFKSGAKFGEILGDQKLRLPLLCLVLAGSLWGYVVSFLPYTMSLRDLSGSLFLAMSSVGLLFSRFLIADQLRERDHGTVSGAAIAVMAITLLVLTWASTAFSVGVLGVLFGMSYALAYPFVSVWILNIVDKNVHHIAIALTNTVFNFFMFAAPFFVAFSVEVLTISIGHFQNLLAAFSVGCLILGFSVMRIR